MKKILVLGVIALCSTTMFAQSTASATLNVILPEIRTIEVLQPTVSLPLVDATDLQNAAASAGVSTTQASHLKIVSTTGFRVTVTASGPLSNNGETISQDKVLLSVSNPVNIVPTATNQLAGYLPVIDHNLGTQTAMPIIQTNAAMGGTTGTNFDVKYKLANVSNISSLGSGTYTTQITYAILPL